MYQNENENMLGGKQIVVENNYKTLRVFSAKPKPGSGEVNYRQWRRAAIRVVEDKELSAARKKRLILDSIQGKAEDVVDYSRDLPVLDIISLLDCNYKSVVDGDDKLADFYQMVQGDDYERSSDYLRDLYVELVEVVKEHGVAEASMPRLLLSQFLRGSTDEDLITKLRLSDARDSTNPPTFTMFLMKVRKEESQREERKLRLKRTTVTSGKANAQLTAKEEDPEMDGMRRRLNRLESKCSAMLSDPLQYDTEEGEEDFQLLQQRMELLEEQITVSSNVTFCYRCGIDQHVATDCANEPNKVLVGKKLKSRAERRQAWIKKKKDAPLN